MFGFLYFNFTCIVSGVQQRREERVKLCVVFVCVINICINIKTSVQA